MSRSWQHCDWTDCPKHAREQVARDVIDVTIRFCRSSDRKKLRMKEEAFIEALKNFAYYALCNNRKEAHVRMVELEKML